MKLDTRPASDYPTPDLLRLANLSFEDYLVPIQFNISQFLNMLRKDTVDLTASRVLLIDDGPTGIALIARRGWTSRVAAMGVTKDFRGKKAGSWLMKQLIKDAHKRKDREMVLEVIEQNKPAVHLYKKHGFDTVRRLIGLVHQDAKQDAKSGLEEVNLREMGKLISQYGLPDLPWQLSGETIALMNPPIRAYKLNNAYVVISNPDVEHVVIWSLLVEPSARGNGLGVDMLKRVMAHHSGKIWHVPAIGPEEFGILFERAGFQREKLSQWQMKLRL
ncbi:MAG TPA: N-acetyltransferase [Anaerolineales bacterium]|nr:N-acetyltransferase [Anaerolineales bacterium]